MKHENFTKRSYILENSIFDGYRVLNMEIILKKKIVYITFKNMEYDGKLARQKGIVHI